MMQLSRLHASSWLRLSLEEGNLLQGRRLKSNQPGAEWLRNIRKHDKESGLKKCATIHEAAKQEWH